FAAATVLPLSDAVIQQAVKLRQMKKMTLGDALVAGTALTHGRTLVTRNARDFAWVPGLKVFNPFEP
ncbi:MAG TPA: type II toxin-antitoxin system VapC family toxin, partial [Gemmataceae bacterium]|nr:type II toxin-antitoxin system VapC family toxin [Gemmataceae bacterium]